MSLAVFLSGPTLPGVLCTEKAQLQNGADAAALAVAQDCATRGNANCQGAAHGKALGFVNSFGGAHRRRITGGSPLVWSTGYHVVKLKTGKVPA